MYLVVGKILLTKLYKKFTFLHSCNGRMSGSNAYNTYIILIQARIEGEQRDNYSFFVDFDKFFIL